MPLFLFLFFLIFIHTYIHGDGDMEIYLDILTYGYNLYDGRGPLT
jgi:hypothetical protein